jgi:Ca2+-binding EF-hand superfamily protein
VCVPYFKDIFKDLQERSDNKAKGINKISFINYCQLPGLIAERLFVILDVDTNNYLSQDEFLTGMLVFYCSDFDEKVKLIFNVYDFDQDGLISEQDIITIISCMPVNQKANIRHEGKYTTEGGGA